MNTQKTTTLFFSLRTCVMSILVFMFFIAPNLSFARTSDNPLILNDD